MYYSFSDLAPAHPFRFAVTPAPPTSLDAWRTEVLRIEAIGFDTVVVADHFTGGWTVEPMVALTAAAMLTTSLHLMTGVLGNDYRQPVLVHRMASLLDLLSDGRFILGIGAGWMTSDYQAAGIRLDPPAERVTRLERTIATLKERFSEERRPPLFVGGGSPRVLRLAGREAEMVGVNASLRAGEMGRHAIVDLGAERVLEKVGWVREAAAGRPVELEMNHWLVKVTPTVAAGRDFLERIAARYDVSSADLAGSPSVLVGTVDQCVDTLVERRERFGFSFLQLDAGFPPPDLAALAPIVERLRGR
jgi:probable F420-dependent oxidoreductase